MKLIHLALDQEQDPLDNCVEYILHIFHRDDQGTIFDPLDGIIRYVKRDIDVEYVIAPVEFSLDLEAMHLLAHSFGNSPAKSTNLVIEFEKHLVDSWVSEAFWENHSVRGRRPR